MKKLFLILFAILCLVVMPTIVFAESDGASSTPDLLTDDYDEEYYEEEEVEPVFDPLEPVNRVFFEFNDKLYFWILKPVKTGYTAVFPEDIRNMVGNFFFNLASPVRLVNNLLQGDVEGAGIVVSRFVINSTMGVFGFGDPAYSEFDLAPQPADLGQTLGSYGIGDGLYICWPIFGPSNIRDTFGTVGDIYLHPMVYVETTTAESVLYYSTNRVNAMSLSPDVYEDVKKYSVDPYVATRQAYSEYRTNRISNATE
jgi:phospholipid-binding lipoprotein MlaA